MSVSLNKLKELYVLGNEQYYGDNLTKTQHMLQCATLAKKNEENDEIILACLLHDVGHFLEEDDMDGYGVKDNGKIGAKYLKELGFNKNICKLVEKHTDAKRYLVTKKLNNYYDKLSEVSKKTFEYQGGKMSSEELKKMDRNNRLMDIIKVRQYGDRAKNPNKGPYKIETFVPLLEKYIK